MTRNPIKPALRKHSGKFKNDIFFENLQKKRLEMGFKQEEIAEILKMQRSHYSRLEAGTFPQDPRRIVDIARALKVDINWLFGFVPDE